MKEHESVLVFADGPWTYNKQMQERAPGSEDGVRRIFATKTANYGAFVGSERTITDDRVPSSWQIFERERGLHPTQKPVALMEYLIRTYTNVRETSSTTRWAAERQETDQR